MSRIPPLYRIILALAVVFLSLIGSSASAQGATVVRVDPSTISVKVGDTGNFAVKVENVSNLTAIELHLSYNPAVMEVTGMTNGGFVVADFTAQNTYDNAAGTVDYAVAQINRTPATGSGNLLIINFRAKANGISTVTARATQAAPKGYLLSDQNGTGIQASWTNGTINVGAQTPGVTPTTPSPTKTNTPTTPGTTPTSPTTQPAGVLGTHVVRSGEWVNCIGRAYAVLPSAIISKNSLKWPYWIFPNQKLVIPNVPWVNVTAGKICTAQFSKTGTTPSATATTPVATAVPTTGTPVPTKVCRAEYIVRQGDTLYRIGVSFGVNYMDIARANNLSDPRLIYVGQKLCIP